VLTRSNINQWIGPIYSLGQAAGGLLAAFTLDTFGRRANLWAGSACLLLSVTLLIVSGSLAMVLVARVIQGMSIGFLLLGYQVGSYR
jgi:MFS family permease